MEENGLNPGTRGRGRRGEKSGEDKEKDRNQEAWGWFAVTTHRSERLSPPPALDRGPSPPPASQREPPLPTAPPSNQPGKKRSCAKLKPSNAKDITKNNGGNEMNLSELCPEVYQALLIHQILQSRNLLRIYYGCKNLQEGNMKENEPE
ncbi:Mitochondrial dynamics protein MID49 [Manis javanica]|nr:Mitochondrial dynamics protein MID49 [Manis javanica]